jgi:ketosteroid isomerase-like protein
VVDIRDGKFVRWVDYWDGRHFGVAATASLRVPPSQFPADFGESRIGDEAGKTMTVVTGHLTQALGQNDPEQAAKLFAPDAVLEDLTLHTAIVGHQAIASYLARATATLPYGQSARVRHLVGGDGGGAYEWTSASGPVPRGVNAIELSPRGQITHLWSIWDGSLAAPAWITRAMALTIES